MNKFYKLLFIVAFTISFSPSKATVWTVVSSGFTFSPSTITINLGDTIVFSVGGSHNALEVSQATWNANGTTSNGGFTTPFGGGVVIPTQVKTYFYVCQNHASMGMKGQIIVNPTSGIPTVDETDRTLKFNPNPAVTKTLVHTGIPDGSKNSFIVFDITGKEVMRVTNMLNNYSLDVSVLKKGIYFAEFTSEGYRRTNKLVVSGN